MEFNIKDVQDDVLAIQRTIAQFENIKTNQITASGYRACNTMQTNIFIFCVLMLVGEILSGHWIARMTIERNVDADWRIIGVLSIGVVLILTLAIGQIAVRKAAKKLNENQDTYLKRNFEYLRNQSHSADMLIKYAVVALLILSQRPDVIAPVLFLFTGDYLLQNRFFTLKNTWRLGAGLLSIGFCALQFWLGDTLFIWPLIWFAAINLASLIYLKNLKRIED